MLASGTNALPLSDCYALDKGNFLYDFTDKLGRALELEEEGSDFVVRFCVDAQNRSNNGYINFGRFSPQSIFKNEKDDVDFIQEYKFGDLVLCEHLGSDLTGRVAEVRIICGTCPNGPACKDDFGCICNVTYTHNLCKAKVLAALDCSNQGSRIFPEFSMGLQQKGSEVVKNGITQKEYRKSFHSSGFESSQKSVSLYVTSTADFPGNLEKLDIQVQPSQGLVVSVVNRPVLGIISATDSTNLLEVNWKCEKISEQPYEVNIRIPIEGYDPIDFSLHKHCRDLDTEKGVESSSIKVLEVVPVIILVGVILLGITYKCKFEEQVEGREDTFQAAIEVPLV
ncbi:hypothetical protein GOP47_0024660 [Adiantum capillus-veneris]|uniref:Uncharacterized protein n=1 Tax=Adiantum capillus-veneris TaxID=13818 RepID=A0A9D4U3E1_ADICA|nr:hypothetical protein GOP47_0024660 [Adiantum capillus-veneris]